MTRAEHLKYCKQCVNRELDMKVGLICNLTSEIANFENECKSFKIDDTVIEKVDGIEAIEHDLILENLSEKNIAKFKSEQNYTKALITGIAVGILCAILWGVITVATGYQIGYMAIAIGAAVGFSIRVMGKGIDQIFGVTGGVIALLSCLLGNILSIIGFIVNSEGLGYIQTLGLIDYSQLIPLLTETFSPIDLFFYGFAAYEGFKFSFRTFTEKDL